MSSFDQFYEQQPTLLFVDELRSPFHKEKPEWFKRKEKNEGEAIADGIYIKNNFPDTKNLLETAICDFELFSNIFKIKGNRFPIYLEYGKTSKFEEYIINISEDSCTITAGDTEGMRRGIIYIEDELQRREGAFLPLGEIVRTPRIKARITRGFFSPTNRPPKNIDELMNDIDYYPDEYLNRLAHDGTNGIWIYTKLADLVRTDIIPEYGVDCEKRIAKLKKIIARCKRYGIGIYIFFIDPAFLTTELAEKYPDIAGYNAMNSGKYTFCTHSERGAKYCIEAMEKLCRLLPDVAGYIDITYGERPTSCASFGAENCPRCKDYTNEEVVAHTTNLLREGMRRADSKSDFISWTYGYRFWSCDETRNYVHLSPDDVIVMQNFEEMGVEKQLGKERLAVDYWLSYTGPSELYKAAAETAQKEGKTMYAKMQVCCSHEIATLPYIPVPGILFDKYRANVEGVMQCWYFGNYPSMMSKAAGELSFLHDFSNKEKFLEHLAGIYCGGSKAKSAAKAWNFFERAYINYPTNIMFSYYGPMHDGVVWELQLKPKNTPLPRTWQYLDTADGDRIYECMQSGHSIDEVISLLKTMKYEWEQGRSILPKECPQEMKNVIDALSSLIESANNIMNFYNLRFELNDSSDKHTLLSKMKKIVLTEIENSKKMIEVCNKDTRLGYHSEAESFKFFPAQLKKRVQSLEKLLNTEFKEVENRIKEGKTPLDWNVGYSEKTYKLADSLENAEKEQIVSEDAFFRAATDDENLYIELLGKCGTIFDICTETYPMHPNTEIRFYNGDKHIDNLYEGLPSSRIAEELKKYNLLFNFDEKSKTEKHTITIKKNDIGWTKKHPLRIKISANGYSWAYNPDAKYTLGINKVAADFAKFEL